MASYELVFDMGSSYISAGLKKDGFSDKIPSVVAYGGQDSNQIVAVGVEALHLASALNGGGVKLSRPILEGAIIDVDGAKALVSTLLERLINYKMSAFSRYNVSCVTPCGMISSDKKTIESVFLSLGAKQVSFVEAPVADSLRLFREFRVPSGHNYRHRLRLRRRGRCVRKRHRMRLYGVSRRQAFDGNYCRAYKKQIYDRIAFRSR